MATLTTTSQRKTTTAAVGNVTPDATGPIIELEHQRQTLVADPVGYTQETKPLRHMQGYKRHNEPGGIYIIAARCEYFEAATDMIKIKIGLAYKGKQGTMERALEHKTSCPDNLELMNAFAVDDMTSIPMPEDTIGGVHEMERYLHALMVAYGWAHIGQGTEWFAVPSDILSNPDKCPELIKVIADAPRWNEVTCFQRLGQNTNTTKRSAREKKIDRAGRV